MKKILALLLASVMVLGLAACGGDKTNQPSPDTTPVAAATPEPTPTPAADPYDAVRTYWSADQLTQAWGPDQAVEHLFLRCIPPSCKGRMTRSCMMCVCRSCMLYLR